MVQKVGRVLFINLCMTSAGWSLQTLPRTVFFSSHAANDVTEDESQFRGSVSECVINITNVGTTDQQIEAIEFVLTDANGVSFSRPDTVSSISLGESTQHTCNWFTCSYPMVVAAGARVTAKIPINTQSVEQQLSVCSGSVQVTDRDPTRPGAMIASGSIQYLKEIKLDSGAFSGAIYTSGSASSLGNPNVAQAVQDNQGIYATYLQTNMNANCAKACWGSSDDDAVIHNCLKHCGTGYASGVNAETIPAKTWHYSGYTENPDPAATPALVPDGSSGSGTMSNLRLVCDFGKTYDNIGYNWANLTFYPTNGVRSLIRGKMNEFFSSNPYVWNNVQSDWFRSVGIGFPVQGNYVAPPILNSPNSSKIGPINFQGLESREGGLQSLAAAMPPKVACHDHVQNDILSGLTGIFGCSIVDESAPVPDDVLNASFSGYRAPPTVNSRTSRPLNNSKVLTNAGLWPIRASNPSFAGGTVTEMSLGAAESICNGNSAYGDVGDFSVDTAPDANFRGTDTVRNKIRQICNHRHLKSNLFLGAFASQGFEINGGKAF